MDRAEQVLERLDEEQDYMTLPQAVAKAIYR